MYGSSFIKRFFTNSIDKIDTNILNYKHNDGFAKLDDVYTSDNNFASRTEDKNMYYAYANAIFTVTRPALGVVDIGCANGYALSFFKSEKGLNVIGIEGVEAVYHFAEEPVREFIRIADLRNDVRPLFSGTDKNGYDLVICTEVAEHIEPQFEDVFLDNVMHFVSHYLVFSWSPNWCPHRGTDKQEHWNPKPFQYVRDKFHSKYGLRLCEIETAKLRTLLANDTNISMKYKHWSEDITVFRKENQAVE